MITSYNVIYSTQNDWAEVKNAVEARPNQTVLIQVFCGIPDPAKISELLSLLKNDFPNQPIIGSTTAGEIAEAHALNQKILINFSLFKTTSVKSKLIRQNKDLRQAGQDILRAIDQDQMKAIILFGCGLKDGNTINSEQLLRTLHNQTSGVILAGGQAGDNGEGKITYVFTEDGITEQGFAAASLSSPHLKAHNTYSLAWVPIGKKFTITKAEGSKVFSIDDKSPYDIYAHYLGQDIADNLPLSAADFPFVIEREGIPMAIHATGMDEDGAFNYIHNFHAGEQIRFGFCHAGLLAEEAKTVRQKVAKTSPQAIFIYSCVSRKWVLGPDINIELSATKDLAPTAGFFSYGEYYSHANGNPYFFSQTMTVLSLSEHESPETGVHNIPSLDEETPETRYFQSLRVLHRLVDTSATEIEMVNAELAKIANKDFLTGLATRRHLDTQIKQEIKVHSRSSAPLSLIMLDVDYFKQFNDIYGHVYGDDCLRAIAHILKQAIKRPSDITARYGGEEFCCILPATSYDGAYELGCTIREKVENLRIRHEGSTASPYVTVSVGVMTMTALKTAAYTQKELLSLCDQQLYLAKKQGRNQVSGIEVPLIAN